MNNLRNRACIPYSRWDMNYVTQSSNRLLCVDCVNIVVDEKCETPFLNCGKNML